MKQKTLIVADREHPVNFGVNYFYKYFTESTGIDLIGKGFTEMDLSVKIFEYLSGFLYAGHKAECSLKKAECSYSYEDAQHDVLSMNQKEAGELLSECINLLSDKTDGSKNEAAQAGK